MKTRKQFAWIVAIALLGFSLTNCKKDKESGEEPVGGSEFWDNGQYSQNMLHGKVKTVKETDSCYPEEYDLLEYDTKGNLLKNFNYEPDRFRGETYSYDSKGRLTRIVVSNTSEGDYDITEIGYDGRHSKYIPTNFLMDNVRLQRGVTSFSNHYKGELQVKINLQSAEGDRLVFKAEVVDLLADEFGSQQLTITADFNGDFPSVIKITSTDNKTTEIGIKYFSNGMPSRIDYKAIYGLTTEAVFKANAGFMILESEKTVYNGRTTTETYQYNDKDFCTLKRENGADWLRYQYEYDNTGNWTKRTDEEFSNDQWTLRTTNTREYTYW